MNAIPLNPMLEATRLTREGRLREATALLHRALGGTTATDPPAPDRPPAAGPAGGPGRRTIDVDPETGEPLPHAGGPPGPQGTFGRWLGGGAGDGAAPRMPGLRALGAHARGPLARAPAPLPEGARFLRQTIGSPGGMRDYKLYIPGGQRSAPMPTLVMLHGCTQSADDFAAGTRMNALAEEHGFLVVYPEQSKAANAQKCWNWFSPADQRRDGGEPALIAGMTRQVMLDHEVDARRIYVAGLSAGGAAAAIMAQAYPDLYAAVGVHSGLPCGVARDIPTAFAAMQRGAAAQQPADAAGAKPLTVPTIVFHADQDRTVHPSNGDLIVAQVAATGAVTVETLAGRVPGGHAYIRTSHLAPSGKSVLEQWLVHGAGHAWSGGSSLGSYTDPRGPDASGEMLRFFRQHALPG